MGQITCSNKLFWGVDTCVLTMQKCYINSQVYCIFLETARWNTAVHSHGALLQSFDGNRLSQKFTSKQFCSEARNAGKPTPPPPVEFSFMNIFQLSWCFLMQPIRDPEKVHDAVEQWHSDHQSPPWSCPPHISRPSFPHCVPAPMTFHVPPPHSIIWRAPVLLKTVPFLPGCSLGLKLILPTCKQCHLSPLPANLTWRCTFSEMPLTICNQAEHGLELLSLYLLNLPSTLLCCQPLTTLRL